MADSHDPSEVSAAQLDERGAFHAARFWLDHAFTGRFESLWPLTSPTMRLSIAERWRQARRAEGKRESAKLVRIFAGPTPSHRKLHEFANSVIYSINMTFKNADMTEDWGWDNDPHRLDDGQHVVVTLSAGGAGLLTAGIYPAMHFIMIYDPDAGWLVTDLTPGTLDVDPRRGDRKMFIPVARDEPLGSRGQTAGRSR